MAHKTIEKGHRTVMRPGGGQLCPNSEFAAADPLGGTGNLPVAAGYQPAGQGTKARRKNGGRRWRRGASKLGGLVAGATRTDFGLSFPATSAGRGGRRKRWLGAW